MKPHDELEVMKKLALDPESNYMAMLRIAGYKVERHENYIDVTYNGETRRKSINHEFHGNNALLKLLREEAYFLTWGPIVGEKALLVAPYIHGNPVTRGI